MLDPYACGWNRSQPFMLMIDEMLSQCKLPRFPVRSLCLKNRSRLKPLEAWASANVETALDTHVLGHMHLQSGAPAVRSSRVHGHQHCLSDCALLLQLALPAHLRHHPGSQCVHGARTFRNPMRPKPCISARNIIMKSVQVLQSNIVNSR